MKVFVIGIRGFPNIQGGAEKRCEQIYIRLAKKGVDITVFVRKHYFLPHKRFSEWNGIRFLYLSSPKKSGLETFFHSFLASMFSLVKLPDIVHFQNMGSAFFVPLVKIFGIKAVVTFDSINYLHQKWNWFAKLVLKIGEFFAVRFADKIIVVADHIKNYLEKKYKRKGFLVIHNGIEIPKIIPNSKETLKKFALEPKKYVLTVGRFVPEKGIHDLIFGYRKIKNPEFKLVISGDADYETSYSKKLKKIAKETTGVVLTGILTDESLMELYSNAGLFVLPSYHEGLPIALLEALSYGLPVLVSDIPPHKEIPLPSYRYFPPGDIELLKEKIISLYNLGISKKEKDLILDYLIKNYNWEVSANRILTIYRELCG